MRIKKLALSIITALVTASLLGTSTTSLADINDSELGKYPDSCQAIYYVNELIGFPDLAVLMPALATLGETGLQLSRFWAAKNFVEFFRMLGNASKMAELMRALKTAALTGMTVGDTAIEAAAFTRLGTLLPRLSAMSPFIVASIGATLVTTTVFQTACAHRVFIVNNSGRTLRCKLEVQGAIDSTTTIASGRSDIIRSPNKVKFIGCDTEANAKKNGSLDNVKDKKTGKTIPWQTRPFYKIYGVESCSPGEYQVAFGNGWGHGCHKPKSLFGGD